MNSYTNPKTPLIANPVNIERPIQRLQVALSELDWIEKSFGRAQEAVKILTDGSRVVYPQVWQGEGLDLLNAMPNDNLSAQVFFKVEEPVECVAFRRDQFSTMRARVSIIVWYNLQRVAPYASYMVTEILRAQLQRQITGVTLDPGDDLRILRVWETAKNVFAGYTLKGITEEALEYPYGGFRFELELTYLENCPEPAL